jgi:hypothetical protein
VFLCLARNILYIAIALIKLLGHGKFGVEFGTNVTCIGEKGIMSCYFDLAGLGLDVKFSIK